MAISTLTGRLTSVDPHSAEVELESLGVGVEVLLPTYLADELLGRRGERVTLRTKVVLESNNQGATFVPRVIGFESPESRGVFDQLTGVRGLGMRKALKAMTIRPAEIAAAIEAEDVKTLQKLPGVGKRLAETIVAELRGKMQAFAGDVVVVGGVGARPVRRGVSNKPAAFVEAVDAMVALGEGRVEAERLIELVVERGTEPTDAGRLIEAACAMRAPSGRI